MTGFESKHQLKSEIAKCEAQRLKLVSEGLQPAGVVQDENGNRGIVIRLGEGLGGSYPSGEIIVFWENGDITSPLDCEPVHNNLWEIVRTIEKNVKG